jgi:hypothetical protein
MDAEAILGTLSTACFLISVLAVLYLRRTKIVHIADFQVGLRFRKDGTYGVLSAGCYRTGAGLSPITVIDMRPRQFILERMTFQDALRTPSVISVAGELVISDPQTATNTFKDVLDGSVAIIREGLCPAASRSVVSATQDAREMLAATITSEMNRALEPSGVMIRNLEITELWTQPVTYAFASEMN